MGWSLSHIRCHMERRCTYRTSQDITPKDRTSKDIRSRPQNIQASKRPNYKTSQASKRPSPKTSQMQNVQPSKRPKPQNVPSPKRSQKQNVPSLKRPKCPGIRDQVVQVFIFLFLIIFSKQTTHFFQNYIKEHYHEIYYNFVFCF